MLEGRVYIRITAAGFEFNVNGLFSEDEEKIGVIAASILKAVQEIDGDAVKATVNLRISSHLKVLPDVEQFLSEILSLQQELTDLATEAVVFRVNPEGLVADESRAVIAKSLAFPEAIFFDLNISYKSSGGMETLIPAVAADYDRILLRFGLVEMETNEH